jgi:hypothetical protein
MSAQEILIEEIKHQPEPVAREVLHYLKFLKRQRETEAPMDSVVADTWEKLGPPPEVDYDKL